MSSPAISSPAISSPAISSPAISSPAISSPAINLRHAALTLLLGLCAWGCSDDSPAEDAGDMSDAMDAENEGDEMGGEPPAFSERGVCGARASGVVTADDFQIEEQRYLLGDGGFGTDICTISVPVTRVGDAPPGCDENAGQQEECLWTHLVEYGTPTVVLDENGACANSELGMDAEAIAALEGVQVAYGYVFEYIGHNSVLMVYDEQQQTWMPGSNAGWDEMTGDFLFDDRQGACNYAP